MDKSYRQLFTMIARAMELNSERVMEEDKKKNDESGYQAAQKMRTGYAQLHDNLEKEDYILTKVDCAQLLVGCTVISAQLEGKIASEKKALQGYKIDTMPNLQQVLNAADEDVTQLIQNLFTTSETEQA